MSQNTTKKEMGFSHTMIVAVLVVASVVGFAGWRVMTSNDSDVSLSTNSAEESEVIEELPEDLTGFVELEEIQAKIGEDTEILSIKLEYEDGVFVYVVHFSDGTVKAYSATSGDEVVYDNTDETEDENDSESIPRGYAFGISLQEAVRKAKEQNPDVKVRKVEVEVEDGVVVFSVRFTDGSRVDIDAKNGNVTRVKTESNEEKDDSDERDSDDEDEADDDSRASEDEDEDEDEDEEDEDDDDEDDERDNRGSGSRE